MAVGNTFGATALSSYGGFWLAFAIILTPGGFDIAASIETADGAPGFYNSFGFFLMVSFYNKSEIPLLTANCMTGMVHLHHDSPRLHAQVDGRLFPALLYP